MRLPVKINENAIPLFLRKLLRAQKDPRLLLKEGIRRENAHTLSAFKFDSTFKTTRSQRHALTDKRIRELQVVGNSVILDVGASDGTTSLELMEKIEFSLFFVTDYNLEVYFRKDKDRTFFYNADGECILYVSDFLVIYPQFFRPFQWWFRHQHRLSGKDTMELPSFLMVNEELKTKALQDKRIKILRFNVFDDWKFEPPDIIKVANLLNRAYFSDALIKEAFMKLSATLKENGFLVVIDNRSEEHATIWQKRAGKLIWMENINQGSEVKSIMP